MLTLKRKRVSPDSMVTKKTRMPRTPSSWDPQDDALLRHLKEQLKLGWKEIANHFPTRTPNACQFRWRRLISGKLRSHVNASLKKEINISKTLASIAQYANANNNIKNNSNSSVALVGKEDTPSNGTKNTSNLTVARAATITATTTTTTTTITDANGLMKNNNNISKNNLSSLNTKFSTRSRSSSSSSLSSYSSFSSSSSSLNSPSLSSPDDEHNVNQFSAITDRINYINPKSNLDIIPLQTNSDRSELINNQIYNTNVFYAQPAIYPVCNNFNFNLPQPQRALYFNDQLPISRTPYSPNNVTLSWTAEEDDLLLRKDLRMEELSILFPTRSEDEIKNRIFELSLNNFPHSNPSNFYGISSASYFPPNSNQVFPANSTNSSCFSSSNPVSVCSTPTSPSFPYNPNNVNNSNYGYNGNLFNRRNDEMGILPLPMAIPNTNLMQNRESFYLNNPGLSSSLTSISSTTSENSPNLFPTPCLLPNGVQGASDENNTSKNDKNDDGKHDIVLPHLAGMDYYRMLPIPKSFLRKEVAYSQDTMDCEKNVDDNKNDGENIKIETNIYNSKEESSIRSSLNGILNKKRDFKKGLPVPKLPSLTSFNMQAFTQAESLLAPSF